MGGKKKKKFTHACLLDSMCLCAVELNLSEAQPQVTKGFCFLIKYDQTKYDHAESKTCMAFPISWIE